MFLDILATPLSLLTLFRLKSYVNGFFNPPRVTVGVKTNPPSSPSPRGYPYEFELKCNREYVLIP